MAERPHGIGAALATALLAPLLAQLLAPPLHAQEPGNHAGFGATYRQFDLRAATGNATHLGCCDLGGVTWISARDPLRQGNHVLYALDGNGAATATIAQPAAHASSLFGMRDLCTDGAAIAGGSEAGITIVTPQGALATTWDGHPVPQQPIGGAMLQQLGVPRGLCWDGKAGGGAGRFYAVNFGSPIVEFDLQGNVTATFANQGWSGTGLALDARTGNVWIDACPIGWLGELDRQGGSWQPTGRRIARAVPGAEGGGLSEAAPQAGRHAPWPSELLLANVNQRGNDVLAVQRVDLWSGRRGADEVRLEIGTGLGPIGADLARFGALDTLHLQLVDPTGAHLGAPAWILWNFPPEAWTDDATDLSALGLGLGLLPEHRTHNPFSLQPAPMLFTLALGIGAAIALPLDPIVGVPPDLLLKAQAIWFDPTAPHGLVSTNEAHWLGGLPQTGVLVEAVGADDAARDPTRAFWTIRHDGGCAPIRSVTLDWGGAAAAGVHPCWFDLEQTVGDGRPDGGNGAGACQGTFRGGSDVATGLDYAFAANHRAACAAGAANAGFTLDRGAPDRAEQLTFRFVGAAFGPGQALGFDCDTDGGGGATGAAMQGLAVRVELTDGSVRSGVLARDPYRPLRAFARL
ncbi:MAG: hypothetical protein AB7O97_20335 [Planctomycetota bacterium]